MIKTGLDNLLQTNIPDLKKRSVGLVINHTSIDQREQLSLDILYREGCQINAVFAPEHGFRGIADAGEHIKDDYDGKTGIPIYSLYGKQKRPAKHMLEGLDALVFDIQDLGVRFYTYIYTLAYCMEEAAKYGLEVWVLDRPNPINGQRVEGNRVRDSFSSFIGNYHLPVRHGMTVGELAAYYKETFKMDVDLKIVKMTGWNREMHYTDTGLHWVNPSPSATGEAMALCYPGTCFIEGLNLSEGRGTDYPFEQIGAPWLNGEAVCNRMKDKSMLGVNLHPVTFTPVNADYMQVACGGIFLEVTDRDQFSALETSLALVDVIHEMYPGNLKVKDPIKERYFFDLLFGTDEAREKFNQNESLLEWMRENDESSAFTLERKPFLMY